jgi:hypothetical protein
LGDAHFGHKKFQVWLWFSSRKSERGESSTELHVGKLGWGEDLWMVGFMDAWMRVLAPGHREASRSYKHQAFASAKATA